MKAREGLSVWTGCGLVVGLVVLWASAAQAASTCSLDWSADEGVRVVGPSGAAGPTFVWQRPDGLYAMYFYDGDAWTFGDTGYATSANGTDWTYQGRVLTHGSGAGFDNVNAVIYDVVPIPGGLRAYCGSMRSTQVPVNAGIFYVETTDPNGVIWPSLPSARHLLFPEERAIGCPRVFGTEGDYVMYFYSGDGLCRVTSTDGLNWGPRQSVLSGIWDFDIVACDGGGYRLFTQGELNPSDARGIVSYSSLDGLIWLEDAGYRLTPDLYGEANLGLPVLADINGQGRMYVYVTPDRSGIRSATAVPEPVSLVSGVLGLAYVGGYLRRRCARR